MLICQKSLEDLIDSYKCQEKWIDIYSERSKKKRVVDLLKGQRSVICIHTGKNCSKF